MLPYSPARFRRWGPVLAALLLLSGPGSLGAQRMEGDLTIWVRDSTGLALPARVTLTNRAADFAADANCDIAGRARFRRLPVGLFQVEVRHPNFQPRGEPIAISSALPVTRHIVLDVASVETTLTVRDAAPLLDIEQTGTVFRIGRARLDENAFNTLGRGTINAINNLPGWLLEANAVLHPRGSEYDTQYVIDGMPLYDNRSLGFVPAFESDEFEAVHVMTANIPAEFGRRLGGVIELSTRRAADEGRHTEFALEGGSFGTSEGTFSNQYRKGGTVYSFGLHGGHTDRYLDPPSLENFTNRGNAAGLSAGLDHDLSENDRLRFYFRSNRVNFLVPNDLEQQLHGQRQDRRGAEAAGQIHYQHVFSPRALAEARGMVRDVAAKLWSNALATPVFTEQDRGFREGVISGAITFAVERNTVKFGGDYRTNDLREQFIFRQTGVVNPIGLGVAGFGFNETLRTADAGAFFQNHYRRGGLVIDAGVRVDRNRARTSESGVSPRLGLAYYWERADLMLRASYDRVFQTPAIENLLLSSSLAAQTLDSVEGFLPVPAARANYYEVGFRKSIGSVLRLDVNHYWRDFSNYYDDDVFLNTGIGFPISFDGARIEGTEVRLEMPRYRGLSAYLSYSNMLGTATSPVTGGLFIEGGEAEELRDIATRFPITQDQRNTVSFMLRYELHPRLRLSAGARYGSGLPVELAEDEERDEDRDAAVPAATSLDEDEAALIPGEILERINFARGRVRPNFQLDFSVGVKIWEQDERSVDLQFDITNATNRLNVIKLHRPVLGNRPRSGPNDRRAAADAVLKGTVAFGLLLLGTNRDWR